MPAVHREVKVRLQDEEKVKETLNGKNGFGKTSQTYKDALYFSEASGLPDIHTRMILEHPTVRAYSASDQFDQIPCSGGIKGPGQYFKPGSTVLVKWQIQNPIKGGQCVIRFAEKNEGNLNSYTIIHPINTQTDSYTGYFDCGNSSGTPEGVEIVIPHNSDCSECTLQVAYKAPNFGEIYQCSDISTIKVEGTGDCAEECKNGGI